MGEHYDHRVVLRAANGNITSDVAYPNFTLAKPAFDLLSGKLREGETVTFHPAAGRGTISSISGYVCGHARRVVRTGKIQGLTPVLAYKILWQQVPDPVKEDINLKRQFHFKLVQF